MVSFKVTILNNKMQVSRSFFTFFFLAVTSAAMERSHSPLSMPLARYRAKDRGCVFGGRTHAIGTSWHPDLRPPFGIMRCITCSCSKVPVKRLNSQAKIQTKVTCHDVRKTCPAVTCQKPKVPRGECCKFCPDEESLVSLSNISSTKGQRENNRPLLEVRERALRDGTRLKDNKKTKHYLAVLTGTTKALLLRATLVLRGDNLHFTLNYLSNSRQPVHVELFSRESCTILHSHVTTLQSKSGQAIVCGVWRNLSKHLVAGLDKKLFFLRATFNKTQNVDSTNSITTSGRIIRHRALNRETFSSTLSLNSQNSNSGAVAMLTLGRQRFNRLHFVLLYTNRNVSSHQRVTMVVKLLDSRNQKVRISVKKSIKQDEDVAEVWQINSDILRQLGHGALRLELTVISGKARSRYYGSITTKLTCDSFQAVLSGSNCMQPARTGATGFATLTVNSDNTVNYEISLVGLSSKVTSISMLGDARRRRKRLVADVIPQYKNGKAEGRLSNLNGKELHWLISNRFKILIITEQSNSGELSGYVESFLYERCPARHKGFPVPLAGKFVQPPVFTGAAGYAWVELTKECQFHYKIVVSGLSKDDDASLTAHLHGLVEISGTQTSQKQLLKGFYGTEACGIVREMSAEIYDHLNAGAAFVQVSTKRYPFGEIRGQIHIPNNCSSLSFQDQTIIGKGKDISVHNQSAIDMRITKPDVPKSHSFSTSSLLTNRFGLDPVSCYSEGRWMTEGSKWAPSYDLKCTVCICQSGSVLCDPVVCRPLACARPLAVDTECCPVCNDGLGIFKIKKGGDTGLLVGSSIGFLSSYNDKERNEKPTKEGCFQESDEKYHAFGSWWHPVFPQFGMMPCANCTCHSNGIISCGKIICPRLTCKNRMKKNPNDCCKSCVEAAPLLHHYQKSELRPQEDSRGRMCVFGAHLYAPGETWKLDIPALGRLDCIECSCASHGVTSKCVRKCPPIEKDCGKIERSTKSCCPWKCSSHANTLNTDFVSPPS